MSKILTAKNIKGDNKMLDNFKKSKFAQNVKENRAVYITAITLLVALAVILSITTIANRSKKPPVVDTDETNPPVTEPKPETNDKEPDKDVVSKLPSFTLPVNAGSLAKSHDAELQVFSNTMQDYRVHLGVDICAEANSEVFASADGTVAEVWEDAMMGVCVAVAHDGDAVSVYKNLATTLADGIKAGVKLKAGDKIGYVGDTAMTELADEPHLHFEMTVGGLQVDPLEYFDKESVATLAKNDQYEDVEG